MLQSLSSPFGIKLENFFVFLRFSMGTLKKKWQNTIQLMKHSRTYGSCLQLASFFFYSFLKLMLNSYLPGNLKHTRFLMSYVDLRKHLCGGTTAVRTRLRSCLLDNVSVCNFELRIWLPSWPGFSLVTAITGCNVRVSMGERTRKMQVSKNSPTLLCPLSFSRLPRISFLFPGKCLFPFISIKWLFGRTQNSFRKAKLWIISQSTTVYSFL